MTNINTSWWNTNKPRLALLPALIFWVVSILCFVFGLSFENPTGYSVEGVDVAILIAFALGLANTMVQIVGNDQKDKMEPMMKVGWYASYLFGIGSNVNFLYSVLNLSNVWVEFAVCVGLGTMIEVLPEKLLVQFLDSLGGRSVTQYQHNNQSKRDTPQSREQRHNQFRNNNQTPRPIQNQQVNREPTYHPMTYQEPELDIPEFLRKGR